MAVYKLDLVHFDVNDAIDDKCEVLITYGELIFISPAIGYKSRQNLGHGFFEVDTSRIFDYYGDYNIKISLLEYRIGVGQVEKHFYAKVGGFKKHSIRWTFRKYWLRQIDVQRMIIEILGVLVLTLLIQKMFDE